MVNEISKSNDDDDDDDDDPLLTAADAADAATDDDDDDDDIGGGGGDNTSKQSCCPIRSSLRLSVASKRQSMTISEFKFIGDMLNNSLLDDEELKMMDEAIKCDRLFFDPTKKKKKKEEEEEDAGSGSGSGIQNNGNSRHSSPNLAALVEASATVTATGDDDDDDDDDDDMSSDLLSNNKYGSKQRQEYLEARKKQSKEYCKQHAKKIWKKAAMATKTIARLNSKSSSSSSIRRSSSGATTSSTRNARRGSTTTTTTTTTTTSKGYSRNGSMISAMTLAEEDSDEEEDEDEEEEDKRISAIKAADIILSDVDVVDDDNEADDGKEGEVEEEEGAVKMNRRDVFLRQASVNVYGGEGFEIGDETFAPMNYNEEEDEEEEDDGFLEEKKSDDNDDIDNDDDDDDNNDDNNDDDNDDDDDDDEEQIRSFSSLSVFDGMGSTNKSHGFRRASANIYGGNGFEVAEEDLFDEVYTDGGDESESGGSQRKKEENFDPWLFTETNAFGRRRDFKILGTSHDDIDCHPHVLSPIQMDRFQPYLPDSKRGESFWLKYSLVRDGASLVSLLQNVRGSPYTLMAMETIDGEVFGGFFSNAWTVQSDEYFGTGESFLWKMKQRRCFNIGNSNNNINNGGLNDSFGSLSEQAHNEAEIEVFKSESYYCNDFYQMCTHDKIIAGGGGSSYPKDFGNGLGIISPEDIGFGLIFENGSLMEGSSSACLTYRSPPLSDTHKDGSKFELVNLEVWGFTPCRTEEEARILEYKNMFFKRHSSGPV